MPYYPCKCDKCGNHSEVFLKISDYKNLPLCCGVQMRRIYTPPMVIGDLEPYISPLDGKVISSKSNHRKHMREHGVIEVGNEKLTRPYRKKYEPKDIKEDLKQTIQKMRTA